MKKIMFYCQYLTGMGHLVRSTEIVRSLAETFKVCLINGGQAVPGFDFPGNIEVVQLPALREEGCDLVALDDAQPIEDVKDSRKCQLLAMFDQFEPDCVITECFPFSKYKLAFELIPLLECARSADRPVKIVCSLRDLIMTQSMTAQGRARKQARICQQINQYYDLILVHSDPILQTLSECFPQVDDLNCQVAYTGYVAQSASKIVSLSTKEVDNCSQPLIVASVGGGRHGYGLLKAIVDASPRLAQAVPHQIHAFAGPFMPAADFERLQQATVGNRNVTLSRFTPHLLDYLYQADLSISLGGYNTTMNILRTGVRSLVLPSPSEHQADEQIIRARKLAQMGIIDLLTGEQLTPNRLAQIIMTCFKKDPIPHAINLQGTQKTSLRLQQLLFSKSIAA